METQISIYGCGNNHRIVTKQEIDGTVPFTCKCPMYGCNSYMKKLFGFNEGEQPIKITHEWYSKDPNEYMLPGELQLVQMGQLFLRQISGNQETLSL